MSKIENLPCKSQAQQKWTPVSREEEHHSYLRLE